MHVFLGNFQLNTSLQILYEFEEMTSGKIFANGYNEIMTCMMYVFHLLEYNASLGPQCLSNDASFVIFFA